MDVNSLTLTRQIVGVKIFFERPSDKYEIGPDKNCKDGVADRISACDLFSLFTADVIKQQVLFVR